MVTICCICGKLKDGLRWGAGHTPDGPHSHGYCPACARAELTRILGPERTDEVWPRIRAAAAADA